MAAMNRRLQRAHHPGPTAATRTIILVVVALFFALPLVSMVEFTLRGGLEGGYTIDRWVTVFTGQLGPEFNQLWIAIGNSLVLAAVTVVIGRHGERGDRLLGFHRHVFIRAVSGPTPSSLRLLSRPVGWCA